MYTGITNYRVFTSNMPRKPLNIPSINSYRVFTSNMLIKMYTGITNYRVFTSNKLKKCTQAKLFTVFSPIICLENH